jgi:A/G-specific adenine glycosylase
MLWRRAEALLPSRDIAAYTQALMDLGATICLRGTPRCADCPVATDCVARRDDRIAQLPAPRPKKILPRRALGILLLERQGEVLLERRPATGIWAGLWSLPEVDSGVDAVELCRMRFGAEVTLRDVLPAIEHAFTHFRLTLTPQPCLVQRWPKRAEEPGLLWLPLADVAGAALPAPIKTLLRTRAVMEHPSPWPPIQALEGRLRPGPN